LLIEIAGVLSESLCELDKKGVGIWKVCDVHLTYRHRYSSPLWRTAQMRTCFDISLTV
jgi:hypothetical protein